MDLKCPRLSSKVSKAALAKGTKVEFEHTNNRHIAECIARAHLNECPTYYTRLERMERACNRG
jgi:hypothetical protein